MGNFMKTYTMKPSELARKAEMLYQCGCDAVYIVDSAGGMFPNEVAEYVQAISERTEIRIGFHGHNNLELAAANALAAVQAGATLVDCSVGGLGRSAGNTRTEMMIPILKRAGYQIDYDLMQVLSILERHIFPILRARPFDSSQIVGGYAKVHSGLMKPFLDCIEKYDVDLTELLYAYGDTVDELGDGDDVEEIACRIVNAEEKHTLQMPVANPLLQIHTQQEQHELIHNSYISVDELFRDTRVLAVKSNLPVVNVVEIVSDSIDDEYIMAEYLYHDEHFIVVRTLFPSVERFVQFQVEGRHGFDILVFDGTAPNIQRILNGQKRFWHRDERVLHIDSRESRHHYLMSHVRCVLSESNASGILVIGGYPATFSRYVPLEMHDYDYFCVFPSNATSESVGFCRLDVQSGQVLRETSDESSRFAVAIVMSALGKDELSAIFDQLPTDIQILDCTDEAQHAALLVGDTQRRYEKLDLSKSITGELLNLLVRRRAS
ncbi:MAG: hypothetical protein IID46_03515 [Planctomycetes bacterium]|nr:hypothetical protein [Planctomycetota bacterium]